MIANESFEPRGICFFLRLFLSFVYLFDSFLHPHFPSYDIHTIPFKEYTDHYNIPIPFYSPQVLSYYLQQNRPNVIETILLYIYSYLKKRYDQMVEDEQYHIQHTYTPLLIPSLEYTSILQSFDQLYKKEAPPPPPTNTNQYDDLFSYTPTTTSHYDDLFSYTPMTSHYDDLFSYTPTTSKSTTSTTKEQQYQPTITSDQIQQLQTYIHVYQCSLFFSNLLESGYSADSQE